ncbi:MAG: phage portal protein [Candidatus Saccharimonadales bacterium]
MGLVFRNRQQRGLLGTGVFTGSSWGITSPSDLVPRRFLTNPGAAPVSTSEAMKNSAVWGAIRLRADLISTLPWRVYRNVLLPDTNTPFKIDSSPSPMMTGVQFMHFLYASQVELDRSGNAVGIIKEWDARTKIPTKIQLVPSSAVSLMVNPDDEITEYKINTVSYKPEVIWHEKQYVVPGFPLGLSPVMYAAYTLQQSKSIQEFATEWFVSGQGPRASLQNTQKKINTKEAAVVAESWRASQAMDEPFIHGNDWEYKLVNAQSASSDWIEGTKLNQIDVARFFNVPADLLDAAISGGSHVTYSNVVQRNLQFLVMHLGPTITRREAALSDMLPRPRQFEFDTDYLMRMDPMTRANWIKTQIDARAITPTEARAVFGRDPMTDDQYEEFFKAGLVHGKASIMPGSPMDPNSNSAIDNQIESGANPNG